MTEKGNEGYWRNTEIVNTGSALSQNHQGWRNKGKTLGRKCSWSWDQDPLSPVTQASEQGVLACWPGTKTGASVCVCVCEKWVIARILETLFCMLPGTGAKRKGQHPALASQMWNLVGAPGSREAGLASSLSSILDGCVWSWEMVLSNWQRWFV